jgi:hypothetical protein
VRFLFEQLARQWQSAAFSMDLYLAELGIDT